MFKMSMRSIDCLNDEGFVIEYFDEYDGGTLGAVTASKYAFGEKHYARREFSNELTIVDAEAMVHDFELYRRKLAENLVRQIDEELELERILTAEVRHEIGVYDDGRDGAIGIVRLASKRWGHYEVLFDVRDMFDTRKLLTIKDELVYVSQHLTPGWHRYATDDEALVREFKERKRFEPRYLAKRREIGVIDEWSRMPSENLYRQVLEAASKRGYIDTDDVDARRYCMNDIRMTEAIAAIRKAAKRAINTMYGINALYGIITKDLMLETTPEANSFLTKRLNIKEKETETMPIKNPNFIIPLFNPAMQDKIKDVIFNPPATIVMWKDGTKTVVKAENEDFDPEKGLAMAITKKAFGNKGHYFETIKKYTEPYKKAHETVEAVTETAEEQHEDIPKEERWGVYSEGDGWIKSRKYTRKNGKRVLCGFTYTDNDSDRMVWKTQAGAEKAAMEASEFGYSYVRPVSLDVKEN